ncbi:LytTR family DNA-binding domain-containing protein [Butyrivibrio hungatei]|uniref:LytTr domain-containing protein n=1 Tax=Butyrivibrio hungatei TaxID=185008 RepID=A0A1D9P5E7_9FIRM|nr:LytTR family DNA-binding domain-containing protein [Butyrivibrio hungatei]AOZ97761.1 LytTr domain-containing protein [Butyrivibrio hungatei]
MKLQIEEGTADKEPIVIIKCNAIDENIKKISEYIKQYMVKISCIKDGKTFQVPIDLVLYIDTVDNRTFVYCANEVYECKQKLIYVEKELEHTPMVRISKNCLLNVSYLKSVEPFLNHRMKAQISNGEWLVVSRKYISTLKDKIMSK